MNVIANRLVGYVLTDNPANLPNSSQIKTIESYCKENHFDLVYIEKETSNAKSIIRPGLWRAVQRLVCNSCHLRSMSFSLSGAEDWLKSAFTPCSCQQMAGLDGLIVSEIERISPIAREGSQFALMLAAASKHLILAKAQRCVSCCNPSAISMLEKSAAFTPNKK